MLKNYFKVLLRNFRRQKLFTLINITGLVIGMACSMLILLYVFHELSFDRYHENSERIYRVTQKADFPNGYNHHFARCHQPWINNLTENFPEIETLIRFHYSPITDIRIDDQIFRDSHTYRVDENVFEVFDFELIEGNPISALREPYSIVLTTDMAQKYFGSENAIGKTISIMPEGADKFIQYTVTGIMQPLPENSHFHINFLTSFRNPEERTGWAYIYLLLKPDTDPQLLEKKFPAFVEKYGNEDLSKYFFLVLQKLTDIHLHSRLAREIEPNGNILYVYIFSLVAFFLILIACINFMSLSTARSLERAKEVGIRKVLGSPRKQLAVYFYCESFLFAAIAFVFALILVQMILPLFNSLTGKSLLLLNGKILLGFLLMPLVTGLLAGSYPALVLSAFRPVSILKGDTALPGSSGRFSMRKGLVVVQLMISIGMIVSTIISYQQFYFLSDKELGLSKEQVIAIRSIPPQVRLKYYTFKSELLRIPGIVDVSASMEEPSREIRDTGIIYAEGIQEGENTPVIDLQCIDQNYVDFMEIELVAGNTFSPTLLRNYKFPLIESTAEMVNYINSQPRVYLINEKAMKTIGWQSPSEALNKQFSWQNSLLQFQRGSIIGVVKNFHQESLRNKIDPLVLVYEPYFLHTFLIKIQPENVGIILSQIEAKWRTLYPEHAFEFVFIDDLFERLYLSEKKQTRILAFFTAVAIFIAFIGIFGLVTYSAERRRKELGIRKVLGASIPGIVLLLVRDFVTYVIVAAFLAGPVAWYFMAMWLQNFAYHIEIRLPVFFIATALALFTAIITVSFNAVKAALINPVDSLRYE